MMSLTGYVEIALHLVTVTRSLFVYNPTLALLEGWTKDGCPLGVFGNSRILEIEF
jgi:hypothetical protein